jgi:DNA-binding LacI/PurR family transcriptional regulator
VATPDATPRPTLDDVARRAVVARSTASRALRGDERIAPATRRRVAEAAVAVGYRPEHSHATHGRSGVAGIIMSSSLEESFANRLMLDIIAGIADGLRPLDMCVLFIPPAEQPGHDEILASMPLDVCFILHGRMTYGRTRASLESRGIPIVALDVEADDSLPTVRTTELESHRALMKALVDLGHTRAAVVALPVRFFGGVRGPIDVSDLSRIEVQPTRFRLQAMVEAGLEPDPVVTTLQSSEEEGWAAGRALLDGREAPTAIVCHSDMLAVGVIGVLREAGLRVPEDVSVTGYDGLSVPLLAPLILATVVQNGFEKGQLMADQARRLLAYERAVDATLPLMVRTGTSIAPPRTERRP